MGGVRRKDGQRRSDVGKGIDFRKKIGAVFRLLALSGQDLSRFGANRAGSLSFLKCLTQA